VTQRLVVSRLRFLGDVILTTPVLEALRAHRPDARIEYVCESAFAPLLDHHPHVDRVHPVARAGGLVATWRAARALAGADWWFELFGNPRSATLAALARPRHSVGSERGLRSRVFGHRRGRPPGDPSAIRHHLDKLVPLLGEAVDPTPPRLHLGPGEAERHLDALGWDPRGAVLLHPGSTWPDKAWPRERWPRLVAGLRERGARRLAFLTPPGQAALVAWLASRCPGVDVLPRLDLRPLLAVLSRIRLYVGNDGGILHASVALGRPTVGLFGPTDPAIWFPYASWGPYRVLHEPNPTTDCPRCGDDHVSRLAHLDVDAVLDTIHGLEEAPGAHADA